MTTTIGEIGEFIAKQVAERTASPYDLRDWFAGQVAAELCRQLHENMVFDAESIAQRAFRVADAMLAQRGKG